MANMIYMAYDGDNAGRLVGQAVLSNDEQSLSEVSARIAHGHDVVKGWVEDHGGKFISGGGDEGTFAIPSEALAEIEQLRADYQFATQLTMTVGVGQSLSEAGKSLMAGKFRGKDQVVQYDPSVDSELSAAQQHVADGTGTEEENKISEAYLGKEDDMAVSDHCRYCAEADAATHGDDCQYCQEHDAAKAAGGDAHCQYCEEADALAEVEIGHDCQYCQEAEASHEHSGDDCQYCLEAEQKQHEHTGDDCQYCAEANANQGQTGQAPQGGLNEEVTQNQSVPPSTQINNKENQTNIRDQASGNQIAPSAGSQEASQGVAPLSQGGITEGQQSPQEVVAALTQGIQNDPQQTQSERDVINQIDPSEMPLGNESQDGVSHSEGYGYDTNPGDEDGRPDLSQVLAGGLDQHASDIQREKVVNLIGSALEGFKANKQILEQAQGQAPQLYASCIAMLKAMIEMGKMLGLGPSEDAAQSTPTAQPQAAAPVAAPQEGAAQAPQQ